MHPNVLKCCRDRGGGIRVLQKDVGDLEFQACAKAASLSVLTTSTESETIELGRRKMIARSVPGQRAACRTRLITSLRFHP